MPIIKSAIKRARQQEKRRRHNLVIKTAIKQDIKAAQAAIKSQKPEAIKKALAEAYSEIDRGVKKGTLHHNTAGRRKSHLAKAASLALESKPTTKASTKKSPAKKTPAKK